MRRDMIQEQQQNTEALLGLHAENKKLQDQYDGLVDKGSA